MPKAQNTATKPKRRVGGRPSKAEQERILREHGSALAREFGLHPLRHPVDPPFRPYYEQVLKGNAQEIIRYCEENRRRNRLASSFYELLGRLSCLRFLPAANVILSHIERLGVLSWPGDRQSAERWYKELKPRCERARQFIREFYRNNSRMKREEVWRAYVLEPLASAPVRNMNFVGEPNERELQRAENERCEKLHQQTMEELLAWSGSHSRETVRSRLEKLGYTGHELEAQTESSFHLECVQKFAPSGMVPKEAFLELALTRIACGRRGPVYRPSQVARRFACRIAGISESTASHKNVRKY
jgi:hypothetical protein